MIKSKNLKMLIKTTVKMEESTSHRQVDAILRALVNVSK